jgi:hypothetical protein
MEKIIMLNIYDSCFHIYRYTVYVKNKYAKYIIIYNVPVSILYAKENYTQHYAKCFHIYKHTVNVKINYAQHHA